MTKNSANGRGKGKTDKECFPCGRATSESTAKSLCLRQRKGSSQNPRAESEDSTDCEYLASAEGLDCVPLRSASIPTGNREVTVTIFILWQAERGVFALGGFTVVRTPDDTSPILAFHLSGPLEARGKFPPSPAWHRNQRRLRAKARVAVRSGLALEDQTLWPQTHHGSTLPKAMTWYGGAGNSSWCGCRSWKWEGGTRCYRKTKKGAKKAQSDGNLLDSSAVLAHASRADLQTTIKQLEPTGASLVAAPDAEVAVRIRIGAQKRLIFTREILRVSICQSCTLPKRGQRSRSMPRKRHWLKFRQPLASAEGYRDHVDRRRALAARNEGQDFHEENDYDMEPDRVGDWWQADRPGQFVARIVLSPLLEGGRQGDCQFTRALAAIVGDRNVDNGDCRSTTDPVCLPAVNNGRKCEVSANVAGMLGKLWEEGQRASSTLAGTGAPSTPIQDWSERKRQAAAGVNTDFHASRVLDDEDERTARKAAAGPTAASLATVGDLRLALGMKHPHDVIDQMNFHFAESGWFRAIPLLPDSEKLGRIQVFTDGSAMPERAWPYWCTSAAWGAVFVQTISQGLDALIGFLGDAAPTVARSPCQDHHCS